MPILLTRHRELEPVRSRIPGLALAVAVAAVATIVGVALPFVGAPVAGVVLGIAVAAFRPPGPAFRDGIAFASTQVLQLSVVLLGAQVSLNQLFRVGVGSLPVLLGTFAACVLGAYWIGRWLGVVGKLRTLVGVGTGVCGASAIAAVTPVIAAAEAEVAYAISTIFLFNIGAVLVFPVVGHLLGLSQHSFGLFAGTAVNDMSSVVATSTAYGSDASQYAVIVKLTRTLLIIPICIGLSVIGRRSTEPPLSRLRISGLVPPFLVAFVLAAAIGGAGLIPAALHDTLHVMATALITLALSAIGLSTDVRILRRTGARPLLLGGLLWVLVSATSLALQAATGQLSS